MAGKSAKVVSGMKAPIRVLIADDHAVVREGLAAMIARCGDMQAVAEATNGAQAIELSRAHRSDVILMDAHAESRRR